MKSIILVLSLIIGSTSYAQVPNCYKNSRVPQEAPYLLSIQGVTKAKARALLRAMESSGFIFATVLMERQPVFIYSLSVLIVGRASPDEVNTAVFEAFNEAKQKAKVKSAVLECDGYSQPHPRGGGSTL